MTSNPTFVIEVDYDQPLNEAIKVGEYDEMSDNIMEKNFPSTQKGKQIVTMELVHFNRYIESEDAVKEMDKMGLRPATARELLAFGAKNHELQREFPIIGLGSVVQGLGGRRHVLALHGSSNGRYLYLYPWSGAWDVFYRVLGVRK